MNPHETQELMDIIRIMDGVHPDFPAVLRETAKAMCSTEEFVHNNVVETWYEYPEEIGRIVYDTETGTTAVYPDAST